MNIRHWLALALLAACTVQAQEATIRKNLSERIPQLPKIDEVSKTPMNGLYEVRVNGAELYYTDAEGNYLLQGRRPFDLICRWGGEEFIALFLLPHGEDAGHVAERLRQQAQRTRIPQGDLQVTLSGGLVLLDAGETLDTAIKRADMLLYRAKQNGRNRIEHEHPATPEAAG